MQYICKSSQFFIIFFYIIANKTIMATIKATGESRRIKVEDAPDASEPVVDPAPRPPELELVASDPEANEPVVVAVVALPVADGLVPTSDGLVPTSDLTVLPPEHSPRSPVSCEALVIAAGVDPQFWYCCK